MISPRGLLIAAVSLAAMTGGQGRPDAKERAAAHKHSRASSSAAAHHETRAAGAGATRAGARKSPPATAEVAGKTATPVTTAPTAVATTHPSPTRAPDALAPDRLRLGPSMYETGRIATMAVAGAQIRQTAGRAAPREQRVERKAHALERETAYPGTMDPATLERELTPRFLLLRNCRAEVARTRHASPSAITASRLTLRWTIQANGTVTDTLVVATAAVDGKVMDCVKRQMSQWTFTFPDGGAVRIERPFKF